MITAFSPSLRAAPLFFFILFSRREIKSSVARVIRDIPVLLCHGRLNVLLCLEMDFDGFVGINRSRAIVLHVRAVLCEKLDFSQAKEFEGAGLSVYGWFFTRLTNQREESYKNKTLWLNGIEFEISYVEPAK